MLYIVIEILISIAVLVLVFGVLNIIRFHSIKKTFLYFLFAVYLSAVYLFVGMPTLQFIRFELSLTIIPFLPMVADLKNTLLNILLFVPLGIMLPFLWKKYRTLKATLIFGIGMTISIELLQIFTFRATDINDVIANTLGTVLGYFIFHTASKLCPSVTKFAKEEHEISVVILSVCVIMFFVQPYLAAIYYQIT